MPKKLFLIDGSNHAFRVQFALPPMNATDGFPTRALYGFTTLFAKILRVHRPDYVVVSFDRGSNFRHELFDGYKGHRPEMPDDLQQQWPHFDKLVEGFGYPCISVEGYEADDVLGTLAVQFASPDLHVYFVTGDKDFGQLVNDHIRILDLMKDKELGPAEIEEIWGVPPERVVDALGLVGDTSDNIPGIPGIGPKKAAQYLQKYGDLEGVIANAKGVGGKTGQRILEHAEDARLSRTLATIMTDVPVEVTLHDLEPRGMQVEELGELFDRWEFGKVARRLLGEEPKVDTSIYRALTTPEEVAALVDDLRQVGRFSLDLELYGKSPRTSEILGASFCWDTAKAVYVPLRGNDLLETLKPLFEDPAVEKIGHDTKSDLQALRARGIELRGIGGDVMLLDYLLAAHERTHGLDAMAQRFLAHQITPYQREITQTESLFFEAVDLEDAARYAAEGPHCTWLLDEKLLSRLDDGPRHVYEHIELPLIPVLAQMEWTGIRIDRAVLDATRADLSAQLALVEARVYEAAGRRFNIGSRHEIRDLLFDELKLPPSKKVKDGWSTDSSVLEELVDLHDLPFQLLEHRRLQKLLNTYLDTLPAYIEEDGRIHTTFNQAVAATGRLSSNDPNLQNIPIRTEDGRRIRECFVPDEGFVFLSADYSQVELRVLAHFCGEEALVRSFATGEDIHRRTASEVFGTPLDEVTFEQRNAAKAINFGLIYGMSAFRLARDLGIEREQAQTYMDEYFGRLPKVKEWLDASRDAAHKQGFVETLFGRRRVVPNIHSRIYNIRKAAEREAVNTRVQGTAADLIKLAMLEVADLLRAQGSRARLLLQVHDELLLEVPEAEVETLAPAVAHAMRTAVDLAVPLEVNTATGHNWNEAHG